MTDSAESAAAFLRDLAGRHPVDELISRLHALRSLRVLVVGDIIIDE